MEAGSPCSNCGLVGISDPNFFQRKLYRKFDKCCRRTCPNHHHHCKTRI